MLSNQTQITLDADAALVLFEFLARFDETERLTFEDPAEPQALTLLYGALESVLVEPFKSDYSDLLRHARARVMERGGTG